MPLPASQALPKAAKAPYLAGKPLCSLPSLPEGEEDVFEAAHGHKLVPSPDHAAQPLLRAQASGMTSPAPSLAAANISATASAIDVRLYNKTAVLGGSFDPPHWGTAWCVRRLFAAGARDVWLMPADTHAEKKSLTPFATRYHMLLSLRAHLCEAHGIDAERLIVTNVERFVDSKGQTLDVLREMRTLYPQNHFVLAVGADVGAHVEQWPSAKALYAEFKVVVLERPGGPWRAELLADAEASVLMSSTQIRALRREGHPIDACAPAQVVSDIQRAGLYLAQPNP